MAGVRKTQEEWFYDEDWAPKMEMGLLEELLCLKELSVWAVGEENEDTGEIVYETINDTCGKNKIVSFYNEKISFLEVRYNFF